LSTDISRTMIESSENSRQLGRPIAGSSERPNRLQRRQPKRVILLPPPPHGVGNRGRRQTRGPVVARARSAHRMCGVDRLVALVARRAASACASIARVPDVPVGRRVCALHRQRPAEVGGDSAAAVESSGKLPTASAENPVAVAGAVDAAAHGVAARAARIGAAAPCLHCASRAARTRCGSRGGVRLLSLLVWRCALKRGWASSRLEHRAVRPATSLSSETSGSELRPRLHRDAAAKIFFFFYFFFLLFVWVFFFFCFFCLFFLFFFCGFFLFSSFFFFFFFLGLGGFFLFACLFFFCFFFFFFFFFFLFFLVLCNICFFFFFCLVFFCFFFVFFFFFSFFFFFFFFFCFFFFSGILGSVVARPAPRCGSKRGRSLAGARRRATPSREAGSRSRPSPPAGGR